MKAVSTTNLPTSPTSKGSQLAPTVQIFAAGEQSAECRLAKLDALQELAARNHSQYEVAGRTAMKALLQQIYGEYCAVMEAAERESLLAILKGRAEKAGAKFRKVSKDAAIIVRYVFRNLDDKQVHMYSTAIEFAFLKQVAPSDFEQFVTNNKGFEGIRIQVREAEKGAADEGKAEQWERAMCVVNGAAPISTLQGMELEADEPCRVMFAVADPQGAVLLKDSKMSPDRCKAVLAIFLRDVEDRNKKATRKLTEDEKTAKFQLKSDLGHQQHRAVACSMSA